MELGRICIGASNGSSGSVGKLITGPTITGTSRFFRSSATCEDSDRAAQDDFNLSSSAN